MQTNHKKRRKYARCVAHAVAADFKASPTPKITEV